MGENKAPMSEAARRIVAKRIVESGGAAGYSPRGNTPRGNTFAPATGDPLTWGEGVPMVNDASVVEMPVMPVVDTSLTRESVTERYNSFAKKLDSLNTANAQNWEHERLDASLANKSIYTSEHGWAVKDVIARPKPKKDYDLAKYILEKAGLNINALSKADAQKEDASAFKSIIQQFTDRPTSEYLSMGYIEPIMLKGLENIVEKKSKGEKLTDGEQLALEAYAISGDVDAVIQSEGGLSRSASIGGSMAAAPDYMLSMALTSPLGGVGGGLATKAGGAIAKKLGMKVGQKVMQEAAEEAGKKAIYNSVKQWAGNASKTAVKAVKQLPTSAASTAFQFPAQSGAYTNYENRSLDQYNVSRGGDGEISVKMIAPTSEAERMYKAAATQFAETFTEKLGNILEPLKILSLPTNAKLGALVSRVGDWAGDGLKHLPSVQPVIHVLNKQMNFNGTKYELFGEEIPNTIIEPLITGEPERLKDNLTKDNLLQTAYSTMAVCGALNIATRSTGIAHDLNKGRKFKKEASTYLGGIEDETLRQGMFEAMSKRSPADQLKAVQALNFTSAVPTDRGLALDYMQAKINADLYRGVYQQNALQGKMEGSRMFFQEFSNDYSGNIELAQDKDGSDVAIKSDLESLGDDGIVFVKDINTGEIRQVPMSELTGTVSMNGVDHMHSVLRQAQAEVEQSTEQLTQNDIATEAAEAGVNPNEALATRKGVDLNKLEDRMVTLKDGTELQIKGVFRKNGSTQIIGTGIDEQGQETDVEIMASDIVAIDGEALQDATLADQKETPTPIERTTGVGEISQSGAANSDPQMQHPGITLGQINDDAIIIPKIELTEQSWNSVFGEDNTVSTPIGVVKMGDNQMKKLLLNNRAEQFNMVVETLKNPTVVINENRDQRQALVFIKSFINEKNNLRYYSNIVVDKDGTIVNISSHYLREGQVQDKIEKGELLYKTTRLSTSDQVLLEQTPQTDDAGVSDSKVTNLDSQMQAAERKIPLLKDGTPDYDAMSAQMFFQEYSKEASAEEAIEELLAELSATGEKIDKLSNKKTQSRNELIKNKREIKQLQEKAVEIAGVLKASQTQQDENLSQGREPSTVDPSITERYNTAEKVYGNSKTLIAPNGEPIKGRYVLLESGVVTPSHNAYNFAPTPGFPVSESGSTVNDRDYSKDKQAQQIVVEMATKYDGRAIESPVIVSPDGVVISGNNRTMSGEIAAQNGTDEAYVEHLTDNAEQFGFTAEQVQALVNPRVVFETTDPQSYTTETFAKFNAQETKTQNKVEKAVKIGKTISERAVTQLAKITDEFETLGELYSDTRAVNRVAKILLDNGVIGQTEVAEMLDGDSLSAIGKDVFETVLVGAVVGENSVRLINRDGMKKYRQRLVKAILPTLQNKALGEYSIIDSLDESIIILDKARRMGSPVAASVGQLDAFKPAPDGELAIRLAKALEGSDRGIKQLFLDYNAPATVAAGGQKDMFTGEVKSKEAILEGLGFVEKQDSDQVFMSTAKSGERDAPDPLADDLVAMAQTPQQKFTAVAKDVIRLNKLSGANAIVFSEVADLPENIRSHMDAELFDYDGVTLGDTSYILAPSMQNEGMIESTYAHEVAAHRNIFLALGKNKQDEANLYAAIVDEIGISTMSQTISDADFKGYMDEYFNNPIAFNKVTLGKEFVGYYAGQNFDISEYQTAGSGKFIVNLSQEIALSDIDKLLSTANNKGDDQRIIIEYSQNGGGKNALQRGAEPDMGLHRAEPRIDGRTVERSNDLQSRDSVGDTSGVGENPVHGSDKARGDQAGQSDRPTTISGVKQTGSDSIEQGVGLGHATNDYTTLNNTDDVWNSTTVLQPSRDESEDRESDNEEVALGQERTGERHNRRDLPQNTGDASGRSDVQGGLGDNGHGDNISDQQADAGAGDVEHISSGRDAGRGGSDNDAGAQNSAGSTTTDGGSGQKVDQDSLKDLAVASILKDVPCLQTEQAEDVYKAEKSFAQRNGMLFTNGTGTGKTFSGLGVVSRFAKAGKSNSIIVVPNDAIANAWVDTAREYFGIAIAKLESTKDAGQGVVVTTYANFRQNKAIESRPFDLVVYDESHYLSQSESGNETISLTKHKQIIPTVSKSMDQATSEVVGPKPQAPQGGLTDAQAASHENAEKVWKAKAKENREQIIERAKEIYASSTKVVMLSATPFAYDKNIIYGDGLLFAINENFDNLDKQGYTGNNKGSWFDRFMVENLGYRMKYNKLTKPENNGALSVNQRLLHEKYVKEGAISGRQIQVPFSYQRMFTVVRSGIGAKIDEGINKMHSDKRLHILGPVLNKKWGFVKKSQFLEAAKSAGVVDHIDALLESGKKVVIYHNFIKENKENPLVFNTISHGEADRFTEVDGKRYDQLSDNLGSLDEAEISELVDLETKKSKYEVYQEVRDHLQQYNEAVEVWNKEYPEYSNLDFTDIESPINTLTKRYGNRIKLFNGTVSKKNRLINSDLFNGDQSGVDIILVQRQAGKEGISFHDKTGVKQRVLINLGLPTAPTDAMQIEGRIYRIGLQSDAVYEYPILNTSFEQNAFAEKVATRSRTAENLAMGNKARRLDNAFKDGYLNAVDINEIDISNMGKGSKEYDEGEEISPFREAVAIFQTVRKNSKARQNREGADYYATAEPIGFKMVELLHAKDNDQILEPSAGHGAIARFIPESMRALAVEPSFELASKLRVNSSAEVINSTFEDLYIGRKFDGVVMNPPFGVGGKMAIEHVEKAYKHLRDGGRLVAIIPAGESTNTRLMDFLGREAPNGKAEYPDASLVADIALPGVAFKNAGTSVATRIIVIDKGVESGYTQRIDLSRAKTLDELFDAIEYLDIERVDTQDRTAVIGRNESINVQNNQAETPSRVDEGLISIPSVVKHTKTNEDLYVSKITKGVNSETYRKINNAAKSNGGYYSSYIKGFVFKTEADAIKFKDQIDNRGDDIRFRTVGQGTELDQIKAKAIADGTFMLSPNGKSTNLTEQQWLEARTQAFKEHFGDWEKVYRIEKLRNSTAVEITGVEITPSGDLKEYRKNALAYGKTIKGEYINKDEGSKIIVSNTGLEKLLSHDKQSIQHIQSIAAIPQLIEKSVFISAVQPEKDNPKFDRYNYFISGLKIKGDDYTVKIVVGEKNGNRYYDHSLTEIEKGELLSKIDALSIAFNANNSPSSTDLLNSIDRLDRRFANEEAALSEIKDKRLISILQANSSKALDENFEPFADDVRFREVESRLGVNVPSSETQKREEVEALSKTFNTPVRVVRSAAELPAEIRRKVEKSKQAVAGLYLPRTGEVYIILDNNIDVAQVQATFLHEVVAHKGMAELVGRENVDRFYGGLYDQLNAKARKELDSSLPRNIAVEEYFGTIAEGGVSPSVMRRVLAYIREFFRELGVNLDISDNDIRYMLWRSANNLRNAKSVSDLVSLSERETTIKNELGVENNAVAVLERPATASALASRLSAVGAQQFREEEAAREMHKIKQDAVANGTFMLSPNGEITNLNERQWLQVRTKAFRKWFGDWEKVYRIEKLRNSTVVEITGVEITPNDDLKEYRKNALEYGKTLKGEYVNQDTGAVVALTGGSKLGGLRELFGHDFGYDYHIQSIAAIPQIIEQAIYVTTLDNENANKPQILSTDYYVCGIEIAGEPYTVKAVVANSKDGKKYYDHKLTQIEKGQLLTLLEGLSMQSAENSHPNTQKESPLSEIKDIRLLSILQTNSSKVLDANFEPMVVYHGTNADFSVFDIESSPSRAAYFTDTPALAEQFTRGGGGVMAVFVDIKNPMVSDAMGRTYGPNDGVSFDLDTTAEQAQVAGHDGGMVLKIGDALDLFNNEPIVGAQYYLFDPSQVKSATSNTGAFDAAQGDIRFRKVAPEAVLGKKGTLTWGAMAKKITDETVAWERFQKLIIAHGGKVTDDSGVHAALYRKSSIIKAKMDRYTKEYIDPLLMCLSVIEEDHKLDKKQVERYMKAKHSLEREEVSGIKTMSKEEGDNWTRETVTQIISEFESKVHAKLVDKLWQLTREANRETLKMLHQAGIMSTADYNYHLSRGWDHYVPLRGWDFEEEGTFDPNEVFNFRGKAVDTGGNQALKKAKGRATESANTIASMQQIALSTIALCEDNAVRKHLLQLVRDNKGLMDGFKILDRWYEKSNANDKWVLMENGMPTQEQVQATVELQKQIKAATDKLIKAKASFTKASLDPNADKAQVAELKDQVTTLIQAVEVLKGQQRFSKSRKAVYDPPFKKAHISERTIDVHENGVTYSILLTDPELANVLRGAKKNESDLLRKAGSATRYMSRIYTSMSPEFVISNWIRDVNQAAMYHMVDRKDGNFSGFMKYMGVSSVKSLNASSLSASISGKAILRNLSDRAEALTVAEIGQYNILDPAQREYLCQKYGANRVYDTLYENFLLGGGETGYVHIATVKDTEVKLNRALKQGDFVKTLKRVPTLMNHMAVMSENSTRFATFLAIADTGKSEKACINYAKNVTVNFNVKGEWAKGLGVLYAFFNATIQGTATHIRLAKKEPARFSTAAGLLMAMGYVVPKMLAEIGWLDEEEELSKYDMMNNVCIPLSTGQYAKIPLMQGIRVFYGLGTLVWMLEDGRISAEDFASSALASFVDNSSPFATANDWSATAIGRIAFPTAVVPLYDVATNSNFFGGKVYMESYGSQAKPESELYKKGVNETLKDFTTRLNKMAGGNEHTPAGINADGSKNNLKAFLFDVNPSYVEHLIMGYTGGLGRFANNVWELFSSWAGDGEELETKNYPILNRFVGDVRDRSYAGEFWEAKTRLDNLNSIGRKNIRGGTVPRNLEVGSVQELVDQQYEVARKRNLMRSAKRRLDGINGQIDGLRGDDPQVDVLEKEKQLLMKSTLQQINP